MFWKKLQRRIFKDKRHIGISMFPTSQCDTGCAHCIDSSDCKNPSHFTKELAETIVREARGERWTLSVLFTGGGEPLLTPELIGIMDAFGSYERLAMLSLITSGFLDSEMHRLERLETLLKRPYAKNIWLDQSFNLYHPSFPERLTNTARLFLKLRKKAYFQIRACMSLDNYKETQLAIETTISNLAEELKATNFSVPLGYHVSERRLFHLFENKLIGEKTAYKLGVEAFLVPQRHVIKTKEGGLVMLVQPIPFEPIGRGAEIDQYSYGYTVCDAISGYCKDTYLIVGPDGSVYPDCSCFPTEHMRLGKIGVDSLATIVQRKDVFTQRITRTILADKRICQWGTSELCDLCKQLVAEKGVALAY